MISKVDAQHVETMIKSFIAIDHSNTLRNKANDKAFGIPLVGFASGDDLLFEQYKDHVGPFYMTPWEVFAVTFRDTTIKAEQLTVISYILPQTEATKNDNRKEKFYPSERWARARIFGEEVNVALRRHIVQSLKDRNIRAVAPALAPQFSVRISPKYGFSSTWSERHAAYAAGLGTFGLCDGLITPVGKAMRTGSVVAQMNIPATQRPYTDHRAYCLYFSKGTCKKCISRCPVGAISESGKNKLTCLNHLFPVTSNYVKESFGIDGYGCGLCQTGVPCESRIPHSTDG
ncbi:4Fe-4S ferredoxin [Desulfatitalea tepidiphila]|uniref:4Fe-4S ferredoxin n=1 Tax=Desulfatitalea tepidiphila TaxID=1185843 RepID=UPI0006B47D62|nr:4Fe-4S ferredoxin [Desulfatitalea tepidiphila]